MASRKNLLNIDYHYDDETGIYSIGELDFGISGNLSSYLQRYGFTGKQNILAMLGYLAWKVEDTFQQINRTNGVEVTQKMEVPIANFEPREKKLTREGK